MNLTRQEAGWLYSWLRDNEKKMPSPRAFQPYYKADNWDLQDLFRAFRRDATENREKLWLFVLERIASDKWPKMNTEEAFWLKERWQITKRYCHEVAGLENFSTIPSDVTPPTDVQVAIAWLLLELWDKRLVDVWIRENARYHVTVDDPSSEESAADLEIYLRKLEGTDRCQ